MKFKLYLGPHEVSIQTEREIRFALVGQRDIKAEEPTEIMKKHSKVIANTEDKVKLTPEECEVLTKFEKARVMGKFEPKVLDWFEREENAEQAKSRWPDRINLQILPISTRLP